MKTWLYVCVCFNRCFGQAALTCMRSVCFLGWMFLLFVRVSSSLWLEFVWNAAALFATESMAFSYVWFGLFCKCESWPALWMSTWKSWYWNWRDRKFLNFTYVAHDDITSVEWHHCLPSFAYNLVNRNHSPAFLSSRHCIWCHSVSFKTCTWTLKGVLSLSYLGCPLDLQRNFRSSGIASFRPWLCFESFHHTGILLHCVCRVSVIVYISFWRMLQVWFAWFDFMDSFVSMCV